MDVSYCEFSISRSIETKYMYQIMVLKYASKMHNIPAAI